MRKFRQMVARSAWLERSLTSLGAILTIAVLVSASSLIVRSVKDEKGLVPMQMHRAVYDLTLDRAKSASDVLGVEGRMVMESRGGPACDGYTSDQRVVTRSTGADGGGSVSDVRFNSWEALDGNEFRFDRAEYLDGKLVGQEQGTVRRVHDKVLLETPDRPDLVLPANVIFPTRFNVELIKAAQSGKTSFSHALFDGTGAGATDVTTFIGMLAKTPDIAKTIQIVNENKGVPLRGAKSWPVRMGYFTVSGERHDETPILEMGFEMYPNGVMKQLRLDFDDVVLKGELKEIEYFPPGAC